MAEVSQAKNITPPVHSSFTHTFYIRLHLSRKKDWLHILNIIVSIIMIAKYICNGGNREETGEGVASNDK